MEMSTSIDGNPRFVTDLQNARPFSTRIEAEECKVEMANSIGAENLEVEQLVSNNVLCFFIKCRTYNDTYYFAK